MTGQEPLVIGADAAGRLLEVGVVESGDEPGIAIVVRRCPREARSFGGEQEDEVAVRRELLDLVCFTLAPGVRIGEAFGVLRSEVDFDAGTVEINSTVIRIKGEGLLRKERTRGREMGPDLHKRRS